MISQRNAPMNHYSDLDGMRGVLACSVMLMHYGLDRIVAIATHGIVVRSEWGLSVDFFLILSGFVLARSFARRQTSVADYFRRRLLRLAPMYFISVILAVMFSDHGSFRILALNLGIMQSLFDVRSLNMPSWSIPFEMYLPALGLILTPYWFNQKDRTKLIVLFTLAALGTVATYLLVNNIDIRHARAFFGLGSGMALYFAMARYETNLKPGRSLLPALFAAIILIMVISIRYTPTVLLFYPLVLLSIIIGTKSHSVLSSTPLQALGRWSYSIYLLHLPVLLGMEVALGKSVVGHNPPLKILMGTLTVALAALCYRFVERPFMNKRAA